MPLGEVSNDDEAFGCRRWFEDRRHVANTRLGDDVSIARARLPPCCRPFDRELHGHIEVVDYELEAPSAGALSRFGSALSAPIVPVKDHARAKSERAERQRPT